jgi:transposase
MPAASRRRRYPSDASVAEWALLEPLLPIPACQTKTGGHPEKWPRRDIVDNGAKWRALPADFPPWETVYGFFWQWTRAGVVTYIRDQLRRRTRTGKGRCPHPVTLIVDSQSIKGASTVGKDSCGYDAAKKINGRKRHITVDTLGLPVMITVTPADIQDRDATRDVFWRLRLTQPQITQVWADRGYAGDLEDWARERLWLSLHIVSRPRAPRLRGVAPSLESPAHDRPVHERPPQRARLRTPAPALRSTPELGTHHHDDLASHPQEPPNRHLVKEATGHSGLIPYKRIAPEQPSSQPCAREDVSGFADDLAKGHIGWASKGRHRDGPLRGAPLVLQPAHGSVGRNGDHTEQVVHRCPSARQADDHQGPSRRQMTAETGECLGERKVMDRGDARDDVVRAGRKLGYCIRDGESDGEPGRSQLLGLGRDHRVGIDGLHSVGSFGQEPCKITAAGTHVQGEIEAPRQLPQDPAMVMGVVIPGIRGVKPFKSSQDTRRQDLHCPSPSSTCSMHTLFRNKDHSLPACRTQSKEASGKTPTYPN